jgi:hypothetical protein
MNKKGLKQQNDGACVTSGSTNKIIVRVSCGSAILKYKICSSDGCGRQLGRFVYICLTAKAKVATVLGSIPASSDTGESEG